MRTNIKYGAAQVVDGPDGTAIILVGTDGLPQSGGALAAAWAASRRLGANVQVVTVHLPRPFLSPEVPLAYDPDAEAARRGDLLQRARMQAAEYADSRIFGSPEVRDGDPARVLAQIASDRNAQLVIVGLGRHNVMDRLFGDETALRLIRVSRAPVLAVPASFPRDFGDAPRQAVIAMDFSEGSTRAARAVLQLLPPGSTARLVHVMPTPEDLGYALIPVDEYTVSVSRNFALLRPRLTTPPDIQIEALTLSGNPAAELLRLAGETKADLIAAGSHGYGFITRLVVGSVTSKLLRGAACAVLVVPPDAAPHTLGFELRKRDDASVGWPAYA